MREKRVRKKTKNFRIAEEQTIIIKISYYHIFVVVFSFFLLFIFYAMSILY